MVSKEELARYVDQSGITSIMSAIMAAMVASRGIKMDIPVLKEALWEEISSVMKDKGLVRTETIRSLTAEEVYILLADMALKIDRNITLEEIKKQRLNSYLEYKNGSIIPFTQDIGARIIDQLLGYISIEIVNKVGMEAGVPMFVLEKDGTMVLATYAPEEVAASREAQSLVKGRGGITYVYPTMQNLPN